VKPIVATNRTALTGDRIRASSYLGPPSVPQPSSLFSSSGGHTINGNDGLVKPLSSLVTQPSDDTTNETKAAIDASRATARGKADVRMKKLKASQKKNQDIARIQKTGTDEEKKALAKQLAAEQRKKDKKAGKSDGIPSPRSQRASPVPQVKVLKALPDHILSTSPFKEMRELSMVRLKMDQSNGSLTHHNKVKTCSICKALGVPSTSHIANSAGYHKIDERQRVLDAVIAIRDASTPIGAKKRGRPPSTSLIAKKPIVTHDTNDGTQDDDDDDDDDDDKETSDREADNDDNNKDNGDNDDDEPVSKRRRKLSRSVKIDDKDDDEQQENASNDDTQSDNDDNDNKVTKKGVITAKKGVSSPRSVAKKTSTKASPSSASFSPSKVPMTWKDDEDLKLLQLVRTNGPNWGLVAKEMGHNRYDDLIS
jgi:hypothetical protein